MAEPTGTRTHDTGPAPKRSTARRSASGARSGVADPRSAGEARGRLSTADLALIDAYWRAANYLSVGQIYLLDNPLLREPLQPAHVKPRLLGHWGTTPGLNFIYAHMNRVIRAWDLDAIYIMGPGHGGPATVANAYLEGTYSEVYPSITRDVEGLRKLFRQFSFPGGIPSHVAPETPGLHPRGRRAGLRPRARLRCRLRQPGPGGLLRRGRRRGRDGPAGDELALQQVPRPRARRRGAAHPAPQRLQDRQPHRAGAHPRGGAAGALRGLRLPAPTSWPATIRRPCTRPWRPRWTRSSRRSRPSSAPPARAAPRSVRAGR